MSRILKEQGTTRYQLSKTSGVAYTTLNDICMGKTRIEKCSVETLYKLAKVLNCTLEQLVEQSMEEENSRTISFEAYKSNVCHRVKALGDIPFVIETLKSREVLRLYECEQYAQAFYLLGVVDYLSRETGLPLCSEYQEIRKHCLDKPIYPQAKWEDDA